MHSTPASSRPSRRAALRAKREALITRSAVLREQLVGRIEQLEPLLVRGQQARASWRWLVAHRHLLGAVGLGCMAGLALIKPRRVWWLAKRSWTLWRWWHSWRDRLRPADPTPSGNWQRWLLPLLIRLLNR